MRTERIWLLLLFILFATNRVYSQQKMKPEQLVVQNEKALPGIHLSEKDSIKKPVSQSNKEGALGFVPSGPKGKPGQDASTSIPLRMTSVHDTIEKMIPIAYGQAKKQKLVQSIAVIGHENIVDYRAISPQELLQGQVSGVQVVNSSGILGAATIVKIRGVNSIRSDSRPLVVLDGVPLNDYALTAGQGGQALNPLSDLSTRDIESISVLKDAAAAAIYGVRGANGVILITTKTGRRNQKTKLSATINNSWSNHTALPDMMSADQFRQFRIDSGAALPGDDPSGSFDWPSQTVRTGQSQDADLSISGGNERTAFYLGANYKDQAGYIIGNNLQKISARMNLNHDANDWLKIGLRLGISQTLNDRVASENNTFAPFDFLHLTNALGRRLRSRWDIRKYRFHCQCCCN